MSLQRLFLVLLFGATFTTAQADKKEKFIVHTRFKNDAVVYLNRGTELLEKGDSRAAQQNFEAAIRVDPTIWPAYLNRAGILVRQGKWQLALQDCNVAMHLRPGFFRTAILRAQVNLHLGKDRDSLADLDTVVALHADDETDALALSQRAWLRVLSSDASVYNPTAALADARLACRLNYWKKANYIDALAAACAATGDFEAAVRYEGQAIKSGKFSDEELQGAKGRLERYSRRQANRPSSG
ncbi:MAG: tetratricopeptide repeat protein [Chthoniobacterales bacterium]